MENNTEENSIILKDIISNLLDKWLWFLTSIIVCLLAAFLYIKYTPPAYLVNAKLLINDQEKGGGVSGQASGLMDLNGLLSSKNSTDNEIEILKTRFLMEQVVRDMQLNIVYQKKSGLVRREIYEAPFKVNIIKGEDTIKSAELRIQKVNDTKLKISSGNLEQSVEWNQPFNVKGVGLLKLEKNFAKSLDNGEFLVSLSSIDDRVAAISSQLSVLESNKQGTVINLALVYPIPRKGEDILNRLIQKYTQINLGDKNAIADSTYKFIKERLNVIATELGDVENKVENFKRSNQLADMSEQGKLLVQNTGEFSTELARAETQVTVLNDLENYIKSGNNSKRVFPSSLIPSDMVFSNLMQQYNALLLEREKQLLSVTEDSPFIKNIDTQISGLKGDILSNVLSSKSAALATRNKLNSQLRSAEGKISGVPQIEKNYLKLARNQQIKQELYIFLMQKAEETAISKTSNISVAKTIDPPKSEVVPISPKKSMIFLIGGILGLILPIAIIFALNLLNTTVSTKEDITALTKVPIVGEISHNTYSDNLIVANQSRSAISEQFRALRTNLSFYLKSSKEKVILLTSSMSGEGKSFTAINLANILALAGKKVLLMELDLRKPGLSAKLGVNNNIGFSNYAINSDLKLDDIIKPLSINKNMFIISSGPLPPNPAETLISENIPSLFDTLKAEFDYIIMDAPPIGVIADAQLLAQYADVTLYLVRQKYTKKHQLSIVNELELNGKMNKLGIVVNDILTKYYGYGYGYGTYGEEKEMKWYSKFFNLGKK